MNGGQTNPDALYIRCDAAMDYDSKNSGGVGFEIIFPDFMEMENISRKLGKYEGANIERLELNAILCGMNELVRLYKNNKDKFKSLKSIVILTDRLGLADDDKTNPYRIRELRKNGWHNHDGKAIKNSNLLDAIDRARTAIYSRTHCVPRIRYQRRKFNKSVDKLAKQGKRLSRKRSDIALKIKVGKRKYDGGEVNYGSLKDGERYNVRIFKKEPVRDQWEISAEFCEGNFLGKKFKIYSDSTMERRMHRHHRYWIKIKKVLSHHVVIFKTIKEIKTKKR
jgi:ribonuclease HI